jgi:hypothetical protein
MLEIDNIVLNEFVILDLVDMEHKLPRHWHLLLLLRKVHKVGDRAVNVRLDAARLDGNPISVVCCDGFLFQVEL